MSCVMKREPFLTSLQDTLSVKTERAFMGLLLLLYVYVFEAVYLREHYSKMYNLDTNLMCLGKSCKTNQTHFQQKEKKH